MKTIKSKKDRLPDEFATAEAAGEFWDTHDSTEYLADMEPVKADVRLERRIFEIEVEADVIDALRKRATKEHRPASRLANDLLRRELVHA